MKKSLLTKIRSIIRRARVSLSMPDTGTYPITQVEFLGKTSNMVVIWPYGMGGQLPEDAEAICFNIEGMEENKAGIGAVPKLRLKVDAAGEVVFGNPLTESAIYFRQNGDIEVIGKNNKSVTLDGDMDIVATGDVNVVAPTINITGNVIIDGTLTVTGVVTGASGSFAGGVSSGSIALTTHTHAQGNDSNGDAEVETEAPTP